MGSPSSTIASSWRPAASDDQSTAYWPSPTSLTPARSFWPPAPSRDASPPPAQALPWRSRMTTMTRAVAPAAARGGFDDARRTVHIWRSGGAATTSKVTGDPGRSSPDVLRATRRRYAPARQTVSAPPRRLACDSRACGTENSEVSQSQRKPSGTSRSSCASSSRHARGPMPAARRERHQLGDELLVGGAAPPSASRSSTKSGVDCPATHVRSASASSVHRDASARSCEIAHAPRAAADRLAVQRHRHGVRARASDAVRHRVGPVAVVADRARRRRWTRMATTKASPPRVNASARCVAGIDRKVGGASDERLGQPIATCCRGGGGCRLADRQAL